MKKQEIGRKNGEKQKKIGFKGRSLENSRTVTTKRGEIFKAKGVGLKREVCRGKGVDKAYGTTDAKTMQGPPKERVF